MKQGQEMVIEVGDGTIGAVIAGEGRPIILFHSLLADRSSFNKIVDPLALDFRVIAPGLPGFGESSRVEGGLAGIADRMADFISKVAGDQRPIVLGNGFGAFVALQMVIRHPGVAAKLITVAGGAMFSEPGRQAFRNMAAAARAKGLAAIADTAMRRLFAPAFQEDNPDLMAARRAGFLDTNIDVFENACAALASLDLREAVAKITVPTLVVVGEQDEATPPPMSRELASLLPDARLIELPGCAHVPQLQKPQEFLDAIGGFLAS